MATDVVPLVPERRKHRFEATRVGFGQDKLTSSPQPAGTGHPDAAGTGDDDDSAHVSSAAAVTRLSGSWLRSVSTITPATSAESW